MTNHAILKHLDFHPLPGMSSPHAQTIIPSFLPKGKTPPSRKICIPLGDGDTIWAEVSTPSDWNEKNKTIVLIHGMTGDSNSSYMIRLNRLIYQSGYRSIRLSLRGTTNTKPLVCRHYHGGASSDILTALKVIKEHDKHSPLILIGFSLGGNIALKLAGELGPKATALLAMTIAVCAPVDLANSCRLLSNSSNQYYNRYYMWFLARQAKRWVQGRAFSNLYEFDNLVTAPNWGFKDADDYYQQSSSRYFLHSIQHPCHLIFAADDPLVDYTPSLNDLINPNVNIWLSPHGGHMGFLGWTPDKTTYFWMDDLLLKWIHSFK